MAQLTLGRVVTVADPLVEVRAVDHLESRGQTAVGAVVPGVNQRLLLLGRHRGVEFANQSLGRLLRLRGSRICCACGQTSERAQGYAAAADRADEATAVQLLAISANTCA